MATAGSYSCKIILASSLIIILCIVRAAWSCELEHARQGCKIEKDTCKCGFGCKSEYRYNTERECRNALRERGSNICWRTPCLNKGTCIQVSQAPGFKCRCDGTGFHGPRCDKACPTSSNGGHFPYECIVI